MGVVMVDHAKKIKKVNVLSIFWGCFKLWLGGCLKTPLLALLTRLTLVCLPKIYVDKYRYYFLWWSIPLNFPVMQKLIS